MSQVAVDGSWWFLAVAAWALMASGCDWSQFGYWPEHTRAGIDSGISTANVGTLHTAWTAPPAAPSMSSPAVANGVVYVGSRRQAVCVRRGRVDRLFGDAQDLRPAVDRHHRRRRLLVAGGGQRRRLRRLRRRQAVRVRRGGVTGCSGTPKTCAPLWTATTGGSSSRRRRWPTASSMSAPDDGKLYAFDAAGSTGCSGTPKRAPRCGPPPPAAPSVRRRRWPTASSTSAPTTASSTRSTRRVDRLLGDPEDVRPAVDRHHRRPVVSSPAVANGVVYVGSVDGKLYAFDAAGRPAVRDPEACAPLWTGHHRRPVSRRRRWPTAWSTSAPSDGKLYAFDAAGSTGCSGTPKCAPRCGPPPPAAHLVAGGRQRRGLRRLHDGKLYALTRRGRGCSGRRSVRPAVAPPTSGLVAPRRRWPTAGLRRRLGRQALPYRPS